MKHAIFLAVLLLVPLVQADDQCHEEMENNGYVLRGDLQDTSVGARLWDLQKLKSDNADPQASYCSKVLFERGYKEMSEYWDHIVKKRDCVGDAGELRESEDCYEELVESVKVNRAYLAAIKKDVDPKICLVDCDPAKTASEAPPIDFEITRLGDMIEANNAAVRPEDKDECAIYPEKDKMSLTDGKASNGAQFVESLAKSVGSCLWGLLKGFFKDGLGATIKAIWGQLQDPYGVLTALWDIASNPGPYGKNWGAVFVNIGKSLYGSFAQHYEGFDCFNAQKKTEIMCGTIGQSGALIVEGILGAKIFKGAISLGSRTLKSVSNVARLKLGSGVPIPSKVRGYVSQIKKGRLNEADIAKKIELNKNQIDRLHDTYQKAVASGSATQQKAAKIKIQSLQNDIASLRQAMREVRPLPAQKAAKAAAAGAAAATANSAGTGASAGAASGGASGAAASSAAGSAASGGASAGASAAGTSAASGTAGGVAAAEAAASVGTSAAREGVKRSVGETLAPEDLPQIMNDRVVDARAAARSAPISNAKLVDQYLTELKRHVSTDDLSRTVQKNSDEIKNLNQALERTKDPAQRATQQRQIKKLEVENASMQDAIRLHRGAQPTPEDLARGGGASAPVRASGATTKTYNSPAFSEAIENRVGPALKDLESGRRTPQDFYNRIDEYDRQIDALEAQWRDAKNPTERISRERSIDQLEHNRASLEEAINRHVQTRAEAPAPSAPKPAAKPVTTATPDVISPAQRAVTPPTPSAVTPSAPVPSGVAPAVAGASAKQIKNYSGQLKKQGEAYYAKEKARLEQLLEKQSRDLLQEVQRPRAIDTAAVRNREKAIAETETRMRSLDNARALHAAEVEKARVLQAAAAEKARQARKEAAADKIVERDRARQAQERERARQNSRGGAFGDPVRAIDDADPTP